MNIMNPTLLTAWMLVFRASAFLFLSLLALQDSVAEEQIGNWTPLWSEQAPMHAFMQDWEMHDLEQYVTSVKNPVYQVYLPSSETATGAGVVVFPGGGYSVVVKNHEGVAYAKWLAERGIVAMVVYYRTKQELEGKALYPMPLLDARRAIRTMRANAESWGIDSGKVGVMGSSAGGHLASMAATLWKHSFEDESRDATDRLSCRPSFAILVYPVISMDDEWAHRGSALQLLGEHPEPCLLNLASTYRQIDESTCPCFLVHAANDRVVPVRNSMEFAAKCAEKGVPVVCHVFSEGKHGFGLGLDGDQQVWPNLLENWMVYHGWMSSCP